MFLALSLALLFFVLANQTIPIYGAIIILSLQSFLAWPILTLLHVFLIDILKTDLKDIGANILLTINICSFILWASVFGYLIDMTGSSNWTFYFISALCVVSLPLISKVSKGDVVKGKQRKTGKTGENRGTLPNGTNLRKN